MTDTDRHVRMARTLHDNAVERLQRRSTEASDILRRLADRLDDLAAGFAKDNPNYASIVAAMSHETAWALPNMRFDSMIENASQADSIANQYGDQLKGTTDAR